MIVCTTPTVGGHEVVETIGLISSETVLGLNIVKDFLTSITDKIGGRSSTLEGALQSARERAIHELVVQCEKLQGNAIVDVDLDISEISAQNKSMLIVVATGTAVVLKRKSMSQGPAASSDD